MSNIDTKSIITSLMAIERRPQQQLQGRVASMQKAQTAWTSISSKMSALTSAAEALAPTGAAGAMIAVTSSDPAVGASSLGTSTGASTATLEVNRLATAHSVVLGDVFSSSTASDGDRQLDVTVHGSTTTFTSADGTIGGLATAINAAGIGINARVLQTSPGNFQLALTSTSTGAASAFTAGGGDWSGSTVARAGVDAELVVDGVTVTRASNIVSDVIDGVELTLTARTSAPVTVTAARDDNLIVDKVSALVDAANAVLKTVGSLTKASASEADRGVLSTDATAKGIANRLRDFIASGFTAADGSTVPAAELGVSLTRDGAITFDAAALKASLAADPQRVLDALGRSGTSSLSGVQVSSVSASAAEGPRTISVTRAASQAKLVGVPMPPPPAGTTVSMTVVTPGGTYSVSFTTGSSFAETAANLDAALRGAGARVKAELAADGVSVDLTSQRFGSGTGFEVTIDDLAYSGSAADGVDAEVVLDGTTYTAAGKVLVRDGIALSVDYTQAQLDGLGGPASGSLRVTRGFAGGLAAIGTEGKTTGLVGRASGALADRISELQSRISDWDTILATREEQYQKKFTAMDIALQKLQAMSSQLGFNLQASMPS